MATSKPHVEVRAFALCATYACACAWAGCECVAGRPIAMTCDDDICTAVVTPSATSGGEDGAEDLGTLIKGRGDHFACRPVDASAHNDKLLLHFVGTGDDPSETNDFVRHACALGFAAVAPMYPNATASREVCGDDDDCYDAFHREIVFGEEGAPEPIDVDEVNSIVTRTQQLLDALADDDSTFAAWSTLAQRASADDYASTVVSGHSQGNGHALYVAHEFAVDRAVLLSGVADRVRSGESDSAAVAWIAGFAQNAATPAERVRSYLHVDEDGITPVADSRDNLALIGVTEANALELPSMNCGALAAHISVVLATFGARCELRGTEHSNDESWSALLQ